MDEKTIEELQAEIEALRELRKEELATGSAWDSAEVKAYTDSLKELNDELKKISETEAAAKKSQDDFSNALGRTIKTFTGVTDASDTLIGSFFKLTQTEEGTAEAAKLMKDAFKKTFTALNVGVSIARKMMESTFAMAKANDQATAAFNRSTGAAGAYDKELVALQQSNMANGISASEMGESYGALQNSLSGFGVMAESERMRLGELGAQFAKVGVSGADFAGTLQTMTRGFGMSTRAATGMQKRAMTLAQTLGKDVGSVLSEMNAALPQLASYGSDAVDMFFDLEKQSQRTGLAVGELIGIAGNYRTFDSAAEAAGNLNAVLDTQLFSTMGLLEAQLEGPEAVLAYMTENLSASIGDWDSLSTFHKEAVANAAGMNVEQMNNLMNQKEMTREEKARAKSLEETMAAGRSLWQELTIFAQNFALAVTPLVNFLVGGLQKANAGFTFMREEMGFLIDVSRVLLSIMTAMYGAKMLKNMRLSLNIMRMSNLVEKAGAAIRATKLAMTGVGLLAVGGGIAAGAAVYASLGGFDSHAEGTDSTSGGMALVGEQGPELIVPPQNSAVINNTTMTALAEQGAGGGSNAQVVAAVQALGAKLDTMITKLGGSGDFVMQVDRQEFGRVINQHLGEPGSQPIRLKTT